MSFTFKERKKMENIIYAKVDNYLIIYIKSIQRFAVTDRKQERVNTKTYSTASLAIDWAERFYKGLIDE